MNIFGGDWTEKKIQIVENYAKAYLTIMNKYPHYKLIYFDGFAGSGIIMNDNFKNGNYIKGASRKILEIDQERTFDLYYFVEFDNNNIEPLTQITKNSYPKKKIIIIEDDCNKKMQDMAKFLRAKEGVDYRVLAFIDPSGMQLNWSSIECLKDLGIDLWVLVPTGLGVNRLLKKNGEITEPWLLKLENFLGLKREIIQNHFYQEITNDTLFGPEIKISKQEDALNKSAILYKNRLAEVFKYISEPYVLKNSSNSTMFHLFLATNNKAGLKIANDVIKNINRGD